MPAPQMAASEARFSSATARPLYDRTQPMPRVSELHVNGKPIAINADAERPLLSVLRDDLELTGCKYGCGEAQCGACMVLLDGVPARSCTTPVGQVGNAKVATVESLEEDGRLHPVQEAFLKVDALQCGYCTSGMVVASRRAPPKRTEPVGRADCALDEWSASVGAAFIRGSLRRSKRRRRTCGTHDDERRSF